MPKGNKKDKKIMLEDIKDFLLSPEEPPTNPIKKKWSLWRRVSTIATQTRLPADTLKKTTATYILAAYDTVVPDEKITEFKNDQNEYAISDMAKDIQYLEEQIEKLNVQKSNFPKILSALFPEHATNTSYRQLSSHQLSPEIAARFWQWKEQLLRLLDFKIIKNSKQHQKLYKKSRDQICQDIANDLEACAKEMFYSITDFSKKEGVFKELIGMTNGLNYYVLTDIILAYQKDNSQLMQRRFKRWLTIMFKLFDKKIYVFSAAIAYALQNFATNNEMGKFFLKECWLNKSFENLQAAENELHATILTMGERSKNFVTEEDLTKNIIREIENCIPMLNKITRDMEALSTQQKNSKDELLEKTQNMSEKDQADFLARRELTVKTAEQHNRFLTNRIAAHEMPVATNNSVVRRIQAFVKSSSDEVTNKNFESTICTNILAERASVLNSKATDKKEFTAIIKAMPNVPVKQSFRRAIHARFFSSGSVADTTTPSSASTPTRSRSEEFSSYDTNKIGQPLRYGLPTSQI